MKNFLKTIRDLYLVKIKWSRFKIGKNFHAGRSVFMWAKNNIEIGDNFHIGKYSYIESDVIIGDNVMIANFVCLVGRYDHHYQQIGIPIRLASQIMDKDYAWKGLNLKITIEEDVWIGVGSIILSGVTIGKGSIIAAGSVVAKDVEAYSIYGGNPARKIRPRFESQEQLSEHIRLYDLNFKIGK